MNRTATRIPAGAGFWRFIAGLLPLVTLLACSEPATDAEQELREWVARGETAAEAKERRELISMIAESYTDQRGYERDEIENILRAYFFRQNNISLLTSIEDIRVIGDSAAEIDLTVGMAGQNDGVLGFSADAYNFELELVRDGDDWLLIAARWGELGEELH